MRGKRNRESARMRPLRLAVAVYAAHGWITRHQRRALVRARVAVGVATGDAREGGIGQDGDGLWVEGEASVGFLHVWDVSLQLARHARLCEMTSAAAPMRKQVMPVRQRC